MLDRRAAKVETTGAGAGGSGGAKIGKVKEVVLSGGGHFTCCEKVEQTSLAIAEWLKETLELWKFDRQEKNGQPLFHTAINLEWIARLPKL